MCHHLIRTAAIALCFFAVCGIAAAKTYSIEFKTVQHGFGGDREVHGQIDLSIEGTEDGNVLRVAVEAYDVMIEIGDEPENVHPPKLRRAVTGLVAYVHRNEAGEVDRVTVQNESGETFDITRRMSFNGSQGEVPYGSRTMADILRRIVFDFPATRSLGEVIHVSGRKPIDQSARVGTRWLPPRYLGIEESGDSVVYRAAASTEAIMRDRPRSFVSVTSSLTLEKAEGEDPGFASPQKWKKWVYLRNHSGEELVSKTEFLLKEQDIQDN